MPLASDSDVAARLLRPLSDVEKSSAAQTIEIVTGLIADALGQSVEWLDALENPPAVLKGLCVDRAVKALSNPAGLASESETLGTHTHAKTHRAATGANDFTLTETEESIVRRAVFGQAATIGSTTGRTVVDDVLDLKAGIPLEETSP